MNIFISGSYALKKSLNDKREVNDYDLIILKEDELKLRNFFKENNIKIYSVPGLQSKYYITDFLSKKIEINVIDNSNPFFKSFLNDMKKKELKEIILEGKLLVKVLGLDFLYLEKITHINKKSKDKWKKDLLSILKVNTVPFITLTKKYNKEIIEEKNKSLQNSIQYFLEKGYQKIDPKEVEKYRIPNILKLTDKEIKEVIVSDALNQNKKNIVIMYSLFPNKRKLIIKTLYYFLKETN